MGTHEYVVPRSIPMAGACPGAMFASVLTLPVSPGWHFCDFCLRTSLLTALLLAELVFRYGNSFASSLRLFDESFASKLGTLAGRL